MNQVIGAVLLPEVAVFFLTIVSACNVRVDEAKVHIVFDFRIVFPEIFNYPI
jgi:hypothetical protein